VATALDLSPSEVARPSAEERRELRRSLRAPLPSIPSRYFYDERGSRLFEQITRLPEYYLTRAEHVLLQRVAPEVARRAPAQELVELGSGASPKVRLLLDALRDAGFLRRALLVDISAEVLAESVRALTAAYPGLTVEGLVADFTRELGRLGPGRGRLIAFLGSTIGDLDPEREVPPFLARAARQLGPGDALLLGVDLAKDKATLEAAYNDSAGVTAAFNRNILDVLNARFGADFEPGNYEHVAFYDEARGWIEMRLRARRAARVQVKAAGLALALAAGDEIRTEISCKYTRESLQARLPGTGLALEAWLSDPEPRFALALLRRARSLRSRRPDRRSLPRPHVRA
jgi:L-histidine N-alpha-methyltransferase